jgi:hypothetical protein
MQVRELGFQAAAELLEPYATARTGGSGTITGSRPLPSSPTPQPQAQSSNPPFKSAYAKFFRPHAWLDGRNIRADALERYGCGYCENAARRSTYNGSLMLKIRRWSDGEPVGFLSRNIGEVTPC